MTDPSSFIAVEEFERVEAVPGTALLRLAARQSAGTPVNGKPTLVIDDGAAVHRLTALPSPAGPKGWMRVAYSAPSALLEGRKGFALELASGEVVDLPAPTPRRRVARREPPERRLRKQAPAHAPGATSAITELERRLAVREAELHQAEGRLAVAVEECRAAQARATAGERMRAELHDRIDEVDRARKDLASELSKREAKHDRRLLEARAELAATGQRADAAQRRATELQASLEAARDQAAGHGEQVDGLAREIAAAQAKAAGHSRAAAEMQRQMAELETGIDTVRARSGEAESLAGELERENVALGVELAEATEYAAKLGQEERTARQRADELQAALDKETTANRELAQQAQARAEQAQTRSIELEATVVEANRASTAIHAESGRLVLRSRKLEEELAAAQAERESILAAAEQAERKAAAQAQAAAAAEQRAGQ
ncbi:MAG: hypothetical protein M3Y17_05715, partial [Actinomycetota bacterium]|nr:hypothetical protein [Actinomycetota bacterium]